MGRHRADEEQTWSIPRPLCLNKGAAAGASQLAGGGTCGEARVFEGLGRRSASGPRVRPLACEAGALRCRGEGGQLLHTGDPPAETRCSPALFDSRCQETSTSVRLSFSEHGAPRPVNKPRMAARARARARREDALERGVPVLPADPG